MIHVRSVGSADADALTDLLSDITEADGTTAIAEPVNRAWICECLMAYPGQSAWHLAKYNDGTVLGLQWTEPNDSLPTEAADIATFTRRSRTRLGIESALFERTRRAAVSLGYE